MIVEFVRLTSSVQSHAGDGNFHLFILFDPKKPEEMHEAHRINENLIKRAIEMEGTCTGEHGMLPKYLYTYKVVNKILIACRCWAWKETLS